MKHRLLWFNIIFWFISGISILGLTNCKSSSIPDSENEYDLLKSAYRHVVLKEYQTAIQLYTKALDLNSENAEAYTFRGMCKYYLKDYAGSLRDYDKAIELQSDFAEAYNLRGISKGELGLKDEACEDWKKAFEFGHKDSFKLIKEFCWTEE